MKRLMFTFAVLGAAMLLTPSVGSAALLVSTADGNGADTALQNDSQGDGTSTDISGASAFLPFRRFDDVRQKMLLLRFDISTLDTAAYADAQLRLDYFTNRNRPMRVYGIADGPLDNWDEAITNYTNAPGILQPPAGAPYDSAGNNFLDPTQLFNPGPPAPERPNPFQLGNFDVVDTRSNPNGRGFVVTDPTQLDLEAFLNADTNGLVSFLIFHDFSNSGHTGDVRSKEGQGVGGPGLAPLLGVIPQNLVPEPTSAMLLLLGSLVAVARRR